ncbi:methyltransferase family protein [Kordiimonas pumila]|uniref:Methyltransferase family protein n=1 Tax=Kordiimonas pumila TaxID=2161677 RepID=A0ABV7D7A8_9PROT|nr:isoprenylcysteine carboxylmethyltransferase family protein [Kordiimonas pumila]
MSRNDPKNQNSGYKVPRLLPLHLFVLAAGLSLWLGHMETGAFTLTTGGLAVLAAAAGITAWSAVTFARAKTTIMPGAKPAALITNGPFRYSRNPIYGAMVLALAGLWSFTGGFSPFMVLLPFIAFIQNRFIAMEERHMLAVFGEEYLVYCMRTRRWL